MAAKKVSLGEYEIVKGSLDLFQKSNATDNSSRRAGLISLLKTAIEEELTSRQRTIFLRYYATKENIPRIAADLGLNKSTVSRHLRAALAKLRKLLKYNFSS